MEFQYQTVRLIEWVDRKVEGHSRLENTMNQFNIIKIYRLFTQQQDINSIQVPIDYKLGDPETYPGAKIWRSKSIEITQSLFSYHCGIMLEINIKRYLKKTHIVSNTMWHSPREIFNLAIESFNKDRRLENWRVIAENKAFNW